MIKYTLCYLEQNEKLLMLNRQSTPLMGLWHGVGGKIEYNETPDNSVRREILEETGLVVPDVQFRGKVTWTIDNLLSGGMYLFYSNISTTSALETPLQMQEGILDWKEIDWVLDPENQGVPPHTRYFLPTLLAKGLPYHHHISFHNQQITNYERNLLNNTSVKKGQLVTQSNL
ncbi:NUDIX hydrolase [Alteribacter populi]|uniref:NUDIX hydrolase n=1 Tax=Alteribacter populi TaxID=2011011 RepID=UPI0012FD345B|nr:8-oxo-dGTP diphosphatase [Alteribacter populi]